MTGFPEGVGQRASLKSVLTKKGRKFDKCTAKGANPTALKLRVEALQTEGWEPQKPNKKSVPMTREKPDDRQLEDDVWCMLYRLGFDELNVDRQLTFSVDPKVPGRQIDAFAKDSETVLIVECRHAKDPKDKSIKSLIEKITSLREDVANKIHAHYESPNKLKIKWAVALRNIDLNNADKALLESKDIAFINDEDIAYFNKMSSILKHSARYQFLAYYMRGTKIPGLQLKVPASRGKMGDRGFFHFLISPYHLLKIGYVSHRAPTSDDDKDTYQRIITTSRLRKIAEYIDGGGQFPTNIVVNIKTKKRNGALPFDKASKDGAYGTLHLPSTYGCAWMIDGQHRVYAYEHCEKKRDNALVPVLAYVDMPVAKEIDLFRKINHEQVKVARNLIEEIQANINWNSPRMDERLEALHARIVIQLNKLLKSPIKGRVKLLSDERSPKRHFKCLTLVNIKDGLTDNDLVGKVVKGNLVVGPLGDISHDFDKMLEKATDVLSGYLDLFSSAVPEQWEAGDSRENMGYVCTNLGIRALLRLLGDVCEFVERQDHVKCSTLDADEIIKLIKPFIEPLLLYLKNATSDQVAALRARGSSKAGVTQACNDMLLIIGAEHEKLLTPELKTYVEQLDVEGTKEARDLIDQAYEIIRKDLFERLKTEFGPDEKGWWMKGLPSEVRDDCDRKFNKSDGSKERWQFLDPKHYQVTISQQSLVELFKQNYDFIGKGKWPQRVRWLGDLAYLRTTTHHTEKWPATKEQVQRVKFIYELVVCFIQNGESVEKDKRYFEEFEAKTDIGSEG